MEISQGNSLCSQLYLKLAKMSFFSFFLVSFFFYKIRGQAGGTGIIKKIRLHVLTKKGTGIILKNKVTFSH
jgi:hypothetical protein